MFSKKQLNLFTLYHNFSTPVKISWNSGDNRNLFLKLKSKLGLSHVVLTILKKTPKNFLLTPVEMQQLPDIETTDSNEEISRPKWTI